MQGKVPKTKLSNSDVAPANGARAITNLDILISPIKRKGRRRAECSLLVFELVQIVFGGID